MSNRHRDSSRSGYSDSEFSNRPSVRSKQQDRPQAQRDDSDSDFDDSNYSASEGSRRRDDPSESEYSRAEGAGKKRYESESNYSQSQGGSSMYSSQYSKNLGGVGQRAKAGNARDYSAYSQSDYTNSVAGGQRGQKGRNSY